MPADFHADRRSHGARVPRGAAIAIKGEAPGDIAAPARIVAKGHGAVAEQILELAFATGVKVREDADLVEILDAIEVDSEVPLHALAAVAEILSYVYRANGALAASRPAPTDDASSDTGPTDIGPTDTEQTQ